MSKNNRTLSISALALRVGVSAHTLRYYEAQGILPAPARAANGHRRYREDDVLWLEFVLRLKATGMPLADIKRYASLRAKGDATLAARLTMLEHHGDRLAAHIAELTRCAAALDTKMRTYRRMIAAAKRSKKGKDAS